MQLPPQIWSGSCRRSPRAPVPSGRALHRLSFASASSRGRMQNATRHRADHSRLKNRPASARAMVVGTLAERGFQAVHGLRQAHGTGGEAEAQMALAAGAEGTAGGEADARVVDE